MSDTYAPWLTDPDDPADVPTPDDAKMAAEKAAEMFPELVDKSSDGPLKALVKEFAEKVRDATSEKRGRDPHTRRILQVFREAVGHLDASEAQIRDLIETRLMDVAGVNRTKVGDALRACDALVKEIAVIRFKHIKRAFRHMRDHLPSDI